MQSEDEHRQPARYRAARLDFGSLRIQSDSTFKASARNKNGNPIWPVILQRDDSTLEVVPVAARGPLWTKLRTKIRAGLFEEGEVGQEVSGEFGIELLSQRLLENGPIPVRFIGIERDRWLVYATIIGRAATDPRAMEPFVECLRSIQVTLPDQHLEDGTLLPLRFPPEIHLITPSDDTGAAVVDNRREP